jgi:dynactin complex subunit
MEPEGLGVGAKVEINSSQAVGTPLVGTVRYFGSTTFATGKWVGIELDIPSGKNDGSVQGQRYFDCKPLYGVFVRVSQIKNILEPSALATRSGEVCFKTGGLVCCSTWSC